MCMFIYAETFWFSRKTFFNIANNVCLMLIIKKCKSILKRLNFYCFLNQINFMDTNYKS